MGKNNKSENTNLRQKAKEMLIASETRYRRLFESAKDGILILDAETGMIADVNPFLIEMLGYSKHQFLDKAIWEIGFFKDIVANLDKFSELQQKEYVRYDDLPLETADGRKISVEFVSNSYFEDNKKVIQCNIWETTIRKQSELALRNSESHLRTLVQTIPDLIWLKDSEGVYLSCNTRFERLFGASEADIIGKTDYDFVDRDLADFFRENDRKAMAAGKPTSNEEWVTFADDGHRAFLETIKTPMYDSDGTLIGVLGIGRDITTRKQAEKSLKKQKDEFETIFNLVPAQIWYKDTHNNFIRVNQQVCKDIGMTIDQIEGHSAQELFPSFAQQYFTDDLEVFNTRKPKFGINEQTNTATGEIRWVHTDKIPIFGNDGEVNGLIMFAQDITEHKQNVEALELSHSEMENLLNNISDAVFSMDIIQNKMLIVSKAHEKVFGFPPSEFFKNPKLWYELIIPEDRPIVDAGYPILFAGKNLKHEVRIVHPNGQIRWIEARMKPSLDTNGKLVRLDGIVSDTTKRKRAEETLLKLSSAIEQTVDSIMITNRDGTIEYVNRAFEVLTGYSSEEVLGKTPRILKSGLKDQEYYEKLWKTILSGQVFRAEFVNKKKNGDLHFEEITITPIFNQDNNLTHFVGTGLDITDRKKMETDLETAAEIAKLGYWEYDVDLDQFRFNDQYFRLIHGSSTEKQGGNMMSSEEFARRLVCPDDSLLVGETLFKAIESPDPNYLGNTEIRVIRDDEVYANVSVQFKVLKDSSGRTYKVYGVNQDISERKLAETELIIAKEKAEESDRLKSAFLANMSHEVRTPLNSIIGFSELLGDPDFEENQKTEFIQHIVTSGNNLLTIISDIMDISKMESGEITIRKKTINVQKYVSDIYQQFSFQAETHKLNLILNLPDNDKETEILADAERLMQIFNYLIGNAFKFTANGSIEIGYRPKGEMVEFFVKDTGIGIPASYHDKIFDRFRQVDDETTRKYGGNGLGLAITKNLVKLMGGKIWVESEEGKGSAFYFTMPACNSDLNN